MRSPFRFRLAIPMFLGRNPSPVMPLEIQVWKRSGATSTDPVTVKLDGSLDTATAPDLEKELAPILQSGVADVIFDLAELQFISSAGIRVFAAVRKRLKERGGQASFIHMQPRIQKETKATKMQIPSFSSLPSVQSFPR
jgi:anti-anti-sigma factor